jgi:hypothetical protein
MKYLVVKSLDGLGSIMMQLLLCIKFAKITNRKLIIHWTHDLYSKENNEIFEKLFLEPKSENIHLLENDKLSFYPKCWNDTNIKWSWLKLKRETKFKPEDTSFDFLKDIDEDVIIIGKKIIGLNIDKKDILLNFKPVPEIQDKIDTFYDLNLKNLVGVHFRHGNGELDNLRHIDKFDEYFDEIGDEKEIFLCTDSTYVLDKFKEKYSVISYPKWYPEINKGAMHKCTKCPDKFKNVENALIDMYLLSKCHKIICSNGSWFSEISIGLSDNSIVKKINIRK